MEDWLNVAIEAFIKEQMEYFEEELEELLNEEDQTGS